MVQGVSARRRTLLGHSRELCALVVLPLSSLDVGDVTSIIIAPSWAVGFMQYQSTQKALLPSDHTGYL